MQIKQGIHNNAIPLDSVSPVRVLLTDLQAAEHLKPSESYVDGAVRGLKEELNIDVKPEQMIKLR